MPTPVSKTNVLTAVDNIGTQLATIQTEFTTFAAQSPSAAARCIHVLQELARCREAVARLGSTFRASNVDYVTP